MKDQLISYKTAKVLNGLGVSFKTKEYYSSSTKTISPTYDEFPALTQTRLSKFIREERGVHIMINRNASGYFWEMMKSDGGTDLGWSNYSGPNMSGVWETYEQALENALFVQLCTKVSKVKGHWSNYAKIAIENSKDGI